jgi:hypothetical protein
VDSFLGVVDDKGVDANSTSNDQLLYSSDLTSANAVEVQLGKVSRVTT